MILKFECVSELPGWLVNMQVAGPEARVSGCQGLEGGLRIYISTKFLGNAAGAGLGIMH